jgi:hypothetical protein
MAVDTRKSTALTSFMLDQSTAMLDQSTAPIFRAMSSLSLSGNLRRANPTCLLIAFFVILLGFGTGCAESSHQRAQRLEPILAQAGFHVVSANTPVQAQRLSDMTPLKLSYSLHNGSPSYWFADPYVCHCLYVGSEQDYNEFQQLEQERAQPVTQEYDQRNYEEFMASPASQVFYGQ